MKSIEFEPRRPKAVLVNTGVPCVNGHSSQRYARFGGCVECVKERNKMKRKMHPGATASELKWRIDNREYLNKLRVVYNAKNPEQRIVAACKKVAKEKGLPFDLTKDDISIPKKCPVFGIDLFFSFGNRTDNSPSLDRVIPEKGYIKGNVIVISWRANRIKNDATIEELRKLANFYASKD